MPRKRPTTHALRIAGAWVALVLGEIAGRSTDSPRRKTIGRAIVCLYLGLVVANFLYMLPILSGMSITSTEWNQQLWLPSWR